MTSEDSTQAVHINPSVQDSRPASPPLPPPAYTNSYATASVDADAKKGAVEDDNRGRHGIEDESNVSLDGQLGHRDKPVGYEDSDSDYPEPDSSGEHSGQK
jgi:hypothetical protein